MAIIQPFAAIEMNGKCFVHLLQVQKLVISNLATTILKGIENGKTIEQSFYWRMANSFAQPKPLFSQNGIPTSPVFRAKTKNGVLVSAYFLHFDGVVIKYGKKAVGLATAHGVNLNYFNHLNLW